MMEPKEIREHDIAEICRVETAASTALLNIAAGNCEQFDFPMIEPGIDRRTRSSCVLFKSGDSVIEVMVNVIEDTKREAAT